MGAKTSKAGDQGKGNKHLKKSGKKESKAAGLESSGAEKEQQKLVQDASVPDSSRGSQSDSADDIHPSWHDEMLYQKEKEPKRITQDDFELMAVVGKGSFGKVMQVKKKDTGEIFAMKVLKKESIIARKQVAHTRAEKSILQKIQHPFIVRLHYAFQTPEKLYMVMDYVNGGELFFHLKRAGRFSEERVRFYTAEISSAIAHLHSLGIVYRDLKPENILLNMAGHIQITDFGLSKEINAEGTTTFCGTPEYLAPEVLKGQNHGQAVDWWSLGTLVYEMLTGLPPFYSQNINAMYQKILSFDLKFPAYMSPDAQSLLSGLLQRDPDSRLGSGANGFANIKQHPWFSVYDWAKLDRLEYEPPFKPLVNDIADTTQIDSFFTQERPNDSATETTPFGEAAVRDDTFQGFTFVAPSALDVR
eukprot:TRINITY_DN18623_c0_g1_i1.p1 TRINITY_DN18623_c0_g1~~TRINITY_DN18623_c0_g1_i1.p1  ORF type:complete len:417 (-),score=86.55 TRINITY_DN18623_c0_g1_i1:265-1515(-)